MDIREAIEQKLDALQSIINNFIDDSFWVNRSISCTDYGCSGYLNIRRPNGEWVKIRVSDHNATSHSRIFSEIMFDYDKKTDPNNAHLCEYLEQRIRPERFRVVKTLNITNSIKRHTIPADAEIKHYYRIVGRRVASTGREVIDVEYNDFYFTQSIERIA